MHSDQIEGAAAPVLRIPDDLKYLAYQEQGILEMTNRHRNLLTDEMGLGKTVQAIGVINQHPRYKRILVLCPASLCGNWKAELEKWMVIPRTIGIPQKQEWGNEDIIIMSYTSAWRDAYPWLLRSEPWDLIILDEAHILRNHKSKQAEAVFGERKIPGLYGRQVIMMTGTPIVNRPVEAWPLLCYLWPAMFGDWYHYVKRYCGAQKVAGRLEVKGSSNEGELAALLRRCGMIRRLKRDVLKNLPPKTRQIITLSPTEAVRRIIDRETATYKVHQDTIDSLEAKRSAAAVMGTEDDFREAAQSLSDVLNNAFGELATVRRELGEAKSVWVIEQAKAILDEDDDGATKLVIMAHHQTVIDAIAGGLRKHGFGCVVIDGRVNRDKRQPIVQQFQNDPKIRVFIGNMQAAGVGLTLTAADRMLFAEVDWVPGVISQAEDRIHRIGQASNVLIMYMVFENSLDAYMIKTFIRKQEVIDSIMDPKELQAAPDAIPEPQKYEKKEPTIWNKVGQLLTVAQTAAVAQALRHMDKLDRDRASARNDAGYSKFHSEIAGKLCADLNRYGRLSPAQTAFSASFLKRYGRQLPEALFEEIRHIKTA